MNAAELNKIILQANQIFSKNGIEAAQPKYDEAVDLALEQKVKIPLSWGMLSSYPSYRFITMQEPNVAYLPISKCGSTTVSKWLMEIDQTRKKHPGVHQAISVKADSHSYWGYNMDYDLSAYANYFKFVVVRDPLIRFISFFYHYRDRINTGVIKNTDGLAAKIEDIDEFINYFCSNEVCDHHIFQHTRPQSLFLRGVYENMGQVFPIEKLNDLRSFLEMKFEIAIPALTENKSSRKKTKISPASLDRLVSYYRADYELLAEYYKVDDAINRVIV